MMIISLYTRISTFCASILMMGLLSITAVFAQTNSTGANSIEANNNTCAAQAFYVENVEVSALADTSEEARVAATEKGLNDAWMRLLGRIVISDQPLPQLTPKALTPEDLTALLDYTRIVNETVLPSRYQAVFDYCFDRLRTRDYLASANLRHAELRSGPILILPIWETPQGPYLWRKPNPWAESWVRQLSYHDGLLNLKLPRNLATERAIEAPALVARQASTLATAARLEQTERVLLMVMTLQQQDVQITVNVKADLYDRKGNFESTAYTMQEAALNPAAIESSIDGIAATLLDGIEDVWRNTNVVDVQDSGVVLVTIKARSLKEWRSHLNVLTSLPPVENLSVIRLGSGGGLVRIKLAGSVTSLNYALEGYGLELAEEGINQGTYLSLNRTINE